MSTLVNPLPAYQPEKPGPAPTHARLEDIRDFFLWDMPDQDESIRQSFCYCGDPNRYAIEDAALQEWLIRLLAHIQKAHVNAVDFTVFFDDRIFRGHRYVTVMGSLIALRQIPTQTPGLEDLGLPTNWSDFLMMPGLRRGGLILIAAPTGRGKSTTMAAIVRSRLRAFAGYCMTIEEPVELLLHGEHGSGICIQTAFDSSGVSGLSFSDALKSALRCFPTIPGGGTMLMVGEIRDNDTAAELIRAAVNGHLVITTVHASDVATAVARIYAMAVASMDTATARDLLASALRITIHQDLTIDRNKSGWARGRLTGDLVYSGGSSSPLANIIKEGKIASGMNQIISDQRIRINKPRSGSFNDLLAEVDRTSVRQIA